MRRGLVSKFMLLTLFSAYFGWGPGIHVVFGLLVFELNNFCVREIAEGIPP